MQGSGTFAVEAMLTTFVPRDGECWCSSTAPMASAPSAFSPVAGRATVVHETAEDTPPDLAAVERILERRRRRSPMSSPSTARRRAASSIRSKRSPRSCARHGKRLLIDAMSAFGALAARRARDAVRRGGGLLQQVPRRRARARLRRLPARSARRDQGQCDDAVARPVRPVAAISRRPASTASPRRSMSSSPSTRRWRNSAPRAASPAAAGATRRTRASSSTACARWASRRCCPTRCRRRSSPPSACRADPNFVFQRFYDALKDRGFVIYPGKLTVADSFRIGCIGRLYPEPDARRARGGARESGRDGRRAGARAGGLRGNGDVPKHPSHVSVNGRELSLADGADRRHLPRRLGARLHRDARSSKGLAPNLARLMRDGANLTALSVDPELHQPEQPVDRHRPAAGGARHLRQLLLRSGDRRGSDDERPEVPARRHDHRGLRRRRRAGRRGHRQGQAARAARQGARLRHGRAQSPSPSEKADQATLADNGIDDVLDLVGMPLPTSIRRRCRNSSSPPASSCWSAIRPGPHVPVDHRLRSAQARAGHAGANAFYAMMDRYLGALDAAGCDRRPTADHGMNDKHLRRRPARRDLPAGPARRAGSARARRASSCRSPTPTSCTTARSARSPRSICPPTPIAPRSSRRIAALPRHRSGAGHAPRPAPASSCRPTASATSSSSPERHKVLGTTAARARPLRARPSRCARTAAYPSSACR